MVNLGIFIFSKKIHNSIANNFNICQNKAKMVKLSFRTIQKHYNILCISKLFTYPKF